MTQKGSADFGAAFFLDGFEELNFYGTGGVGVGSPYLL
jgi:hypothetical protein